MLNFFKKKPKNGQDIELVEIRQPLTIVIPNIPHVQISSGIFKDLQDTLQEEQRRRESEIKQALRNILLPDARSSKEPEEDNSVFILG